MSDEPSVEASEWFDGQTRQPNTINLEDLSPVAPSKDSIPAEQPPKREDIVKSENSQNTKELSESLVHETKESPESIANAPSEVDLEIPSIAERTRMLGQSSQPSPQKQPSVTPTPRKANTSDSTIFLPPERATSSGEQHHADANDKSSKQLEALSQTLELQRKQLEKQEHIIVQFRSEMNDKMEEKLASLNQKLESQNLELKSLKEGRTTAAFVSDKSADFDTLLAAKDKRIQQLEAELAEFKNGSLTL